MGAELYQSKIFSGVLHILSITQFVYALYFDFNFVKIPDDTASQTLKAMMTGYGGRFRFLTYWCLVSIGFFTLIAQRLIRNSPDFLLEKEIISESQVEPS